MPRPDSCLPALAAMLLSLTGLVACSRPPERGATPVHTAAVASPSPIERGRYLVTIGGCGDCHTPLKFGPNGPEPDRDRLLSGHPESPVLPPPPATDGPWFLASNMTAFAGPWGIAYAANLTPDSLTGLGIWTEENFIQTMRTGRHFGVARPLLPPMPWQNLKDATEEDLKAMYAYFRSIPPLRNQVPEAVFAPPPPAAAPAGTQ